MNQTAQTDSYTTFKKVVLIVTAAVGGVVLVAALTAMAFSAPWARGSSHDTVSASGITQIRVDAAAADFQMVFADIPEAQLDVSGADPGKWSLQREGSTLAVNSGGRFCIWTCRSDATVTLQVPSSLNDGSVALNVSVGAGRFATKGQFSDFTANVGAGQLDVWADTPGADIDLGAGMATIGLQNADVVTLDIAAGRLQADLAGSAPSNLVVSVAVGSAVVTVPDVPYQLSSEYAAGVVDSTVDTMEGSPNVINVKVAAGHVSLLPGR